MHLQVKKLKADIFTHVPRHGNLSPMFLSSSSGRKKLLIYPRQRFFEYLFPSAETGVGRKAKNWFLFDLSPSQEKLFNCTKLAPFEQERGCNQVLWQIECM